MAELNDDVTNEDQDWADAVALQEGKTEDSPPEPKEDAEAPASSESGDESTASEEQSSDEEQDNEDDIDIWAEASDAQKTAYDDLQTQLKDIEHRYKSEQGRVPALQRELQAIKDQVAESQKAPSSPEPVKLPKNWEALKDSDPEITDAVNDYVEQQGYISKTDFEAQVAEKISEASTTLAAQHKQELFNTVMVSVRPDWEEVAGSDDFGSWLNAQDESVQQQSAVNDAKSALGVLRLYDSHKAAKSAKADELARKRSEKQQKAQEIAGRSSALDSEKDSEDALWDEMSRKAEQRMGLRG